MLALFATLVLVFLVSLIFGVVAYLKGNTEKFEQGFIFTPIWVAAAFRLAEPDSWWARHFYDDLQMERARVRSEFRHRSDDPALMPGGSTYGIEPESLDELPHGAFQCTLCGRVLRTREDAVRHADVLHAEVPFVDAKAAFVEVQTSTEGENAAGPIDAG